MEDKPNRPIQKIAAPFDHDRMVDHRTSASFNMERKQYDLAVAGEIGNNYLRDMYDGFSNVMVKHG